MNVKEIYIMAKIILYVSTLDHKKINYNNILQKLENSLTIEKQNSAINVQLYFMLIFIT